ncbi:MAG TPA: hypothetical protein VGK88_02660 [bacterium]
MNAHRGLVGRPSDNPQKACGSCHPDIAANFTKSLHFTTHGQETGLRALTGAVRWTAAKPAYQKACASCHATCGDCHVSKPPYSNNPLILGGLQNGHLFAKKPPMVLTCSGCHGGRVAAELTGQYEGFPADVHYTKGKMTCTDCHSGAQMHGDGTTPANRFAVKNGPECLDCHPDAAAGRSRNRSHTVHGGSLSCQVCHSAVSKSCNNCHAGAGATSFPALKIGLNLRPETPNRYVLLRHVPTTRDMIDRLTGLVNTLQNFDRVPTWKTATPHSIQRVTARSQSCAACHNNPTLFLRIQDLNPSDSQANGKVVTGPPLPIPTR